MSANAPPKGPGDAAGASIEAFQAHPCAVARHSRLFPTRATADTAADNVSPTGGVGDGIRIDGTGDAEAAWLWRRLTTLAAGERGQGTVEYVALILLVAVVLAGVVAATKKTSCGSGDIGKAIIGKIKGAIDDVSY